MTKAAPKRETSQAKRLTALEQHNTLLEKRIVVLEQMVAKLYSLVAGPQIQQALEQRIVAAMQRGESPDLNQPQQQV